MYCKTKSSFYLLASLILFCISAAAYTPQYADEGRSVPLRWRNKTITVALSSSFLKHNTNINPGSEVAEAIRNSFRTWENVADIRFEIRPSDRQAISPAGKNGDGVSLISIAQTPENLLLFSGDYSEAAAYTRIFFNRRGNITEADIVLNPYAQFSTDGTPGTFDLQATLTHEIGHMLGLDHSTVSGSTLFAHQGRNGTYSLPSFSYRTLSDDDITGIRHLYGAETENENCCGILEGKIIFSGQTASKKIEIWLEERDSGRTVAAFQTNAQGKFRLAGLSEGKYRVFAQDGENEYIATADLGVIEVSKSRTTLFTETFSPVNKNYDFKFSGFNGQISDTVIPVNKGNSYLIYFAGKNIENDDFEIGFNSPDLSVNRKSLRRHDYGDEYAVFSVEILVGSEARNGDYSLYFRDGNGTNDFIIGSITVDETANQWTYRSF